MRFRLAAHREVVDYDPVVKRAPGERWRTRPELVSVIIPVLNGEPHITDQLEALSKQDYDGRWEVLIVDNGSTDGTLAVARSWRDSLPEMRFADASTRRGLNHARNVGAWTARGDFLAFCDADDVVAPGWLSGLVRASPDLDIVGGRVHVEGDANWARTRAAADGLPVKRVFRGLRRERALAYLPAAPGGNCGIWSSVARELTWDEAFTFGSSDIEFCWRAVLSSYRLGIAPEAVIWRRERPGLGRLIRQWYAYGLSDVQLFRSFRHLGMPRDTLTTWAWLLSHPAKLIQGRSSRREWLGYAARRAGRVSGSIRFRVLFL